jgi:hypothetical protein
MTSLALVPRSAQSSLFVDNLLTSRPEDFDIFRQNLNPGTRD